MSSDAKTGDLDPKIGEAQLLDAFELERHKKKYNHEDAGTGVKKIRFRLTWPDRKK